MTIALSILIGLTSIGLYGLVFCKGPQILARAANSERFRFFVLAILIPILIGVGVSAAIR